MSERQLDEKNKFPYLVFTCQHNSHPFQQRTISLGEQIKVGRSVQRTKPSDDNALFDCKVLSRSHAIIWHDNGRFWLRDTNSSNGTFINNTRVIKLGNDEFADRELVSGDIIRFGVEVVENDTTHGCIITRVIFYSWDGSEIQPSPVADTEALAMVRLETIHAEKIFRLTQCVNEAMHHEQSLETKLASLTELLQVTKSLADGAWQAMLNEYKLLQKLELYETQLSVLKERLPPDSLQSKLSIALEEKLNLKKASELMLARVLTEKTEALNKAINLESCLSDSERECSRLREECESTEVAYQSLSTKFQEKLGQLNKLENEYQMVQGEKNLLETELRDCSDQIDFLHALVKNQKLMKPNHELDTESNVKVNGLNDLHEENQDPIKGKVSAANQLQSALNARAEIARNEMALTELDELERYCDLQEHLTNSEANLGRLLDTTSGDVSSHLTESMQQLQQSLQLIQHLQDELTNVAKLKMTLSTEFIPTLADSSTHPENECNDQPNEPFPFADGQNAGDNAFTTALTRVQHLTSRVAACQSRAEESLSSFCAMHKKQSVCATSGDISSNLHTSETQFVNDVSKQENEEPAQNVFHPADRFSNTHSSLVAAFDCDKLKELQAAIVEAESNKLLAEKYKEQHAIKSQLLLSVREECDSLRQRISLIEVDVSTNKEDHQRLISEAIRSRNQVEELQCERDLLAAQLSKLNQDIESSKVSPVTENSVSALNPFYPAANSEAAFPADTSSLSQETCPTLQPVSNLPTTSRCSFPALNYPHNDNNRLVLLFAAVPAIMVLCAIMMCIFSKFS